ncbi:MAG: hypothetical protein KatS3mg108_0320 [Isosphaeraceae bacterium]|nr:MAG: hypothetical protein KatS3mg108_0320 [Isosphaeraceae bacterium]
MDGVGEGAVAGSEFGEDRAGAGEVVGAGGDDQAAAEGGVFAGDGLVVAGVVVADGVVDGADDGQVVGLLGQEGEVFAEQQSGGGGLDGLELAADLLGGVGFHVPEVDVGRAALEGEDDERAGAGAAGFGGLEEVGEVEAEGGGRADAQEGPAAGGTVWGGAGLGGGEPEHRQRAAGGFAERGGCGSPARMSQSTGAVGVCHGLFGWMGAVG